MSTPKTRPGSSRRKKPPTRSRTPRPSSEKIATNGPLTKHDLPNVANRELAALIWGVLMHPEAWLETPHYLFENRKPIELVGTDEEVKLLDLLYAVNYGLY